MQNGKRRGGENRLKALKHPGRAAMLSKEKNEGVLDTLARGIFSRDSEALREKENYSGMQTETTKLGN
jgi:hypothetical protein